MVYLVLPRGVNFGWGICGKNLVKELAEFTQVKYITDKFDLNDIGDEIEFHLLKSHLISESETNQITNGRIQKVNAPVLQAIANHTLRPWNLNLVGNFKVGYTFFENNVLTNEDIENGKNNYDIVVTGSKWCEEILRSYGLSSVTTVLQGIDRQLFNPSFSEKQYFKDRFIVFSGGKFEFRKGQDLVIKAYKVLQDRYSDVMLLNSWYNPWPQSMTTMAASQHIRVRFTSTQYDSTINTILQDNSIDLDRVITMLPRPNTSMARIYKNTDIGIFPNRCEGGTNLVLMEYMACGKPVIASYNSGQKDILTEQNSIMIKEMKPITVTSNGKPVAIWDEPDLEEIVASLEWAYHHRDEMQNLAVQAGNDLAQLTWRKAAEQFFQILQVGAS